MTKRQLTDLEKNIVKKQINRIRKEIEHLYWLERYNDLMLGEGLRRNYEEKLREFKLQKHQLVSDIHTKVESIRVLEEQVKNGVDENKPRGVE